MFQAHKTNLQLGTSIIANSTYNRAKNELAPVDTGALRRSILLTPTVDGFVVSADTPYALKVHETPQNYRSGTHHYLSTPLSQAFETQFGGIASKILGGI